jgi:hypothetical protein
MCATVAYINEREYESKNGKAPNALKADAVVTSRESGNWLPQNIVLFRTCRSQLPELIKGRSSFHAPGSRYVVKIASTEPAKCGFKVDCNCPGPVSATETLERAIRAVSSLLNEPVNHINLKDTVGSRLRMFKKSEITYASSSSECTPWQPPLPQGPPPKWTDHTFVPFKKPPSIHLEDLLHSFATLPIPQGPSPKWTDNPFVPFKKPASTNLEDLIHAFSTHKVDGIKPDTEQETVYLQPLVFCYPPHSQDVRNYNTDFYKYTD